MTVSLFLAPSQNVPGVPVAPEDAPPGSLVAGPGHVQFGRLLMGTSTRMKWRTLNGWRNTPGVDVTDAPRPAGSGDFAGSVYAQGAVVTYQLLLRGTPDVKARALQVIEDHTPLDGVARALVVDDGSGPTMRMARLVLRDLPDQDKTWVHGPVLITLQWRCADPLRYSLDSHTLPLSLPSSIGGLVYEPGLAYAGGLDYGTVSTGSGTARNNGNAATPAVITFTGPLDRPVLSTSAWSLAFNLSLTANDTLVVDTATGTVTLSGADRLSTIDPRSSAVEEAVLTPGLTNLTFTALSGTGSCRVTWADGSM